MERGSSLPARPAAVGWCVEGGRVPVVLSGDDVELGTALVALRLVLEWRRLTHLSAALNQPIQQAANTRTRAASSDGPGESRAVTDRLGRMDGREEVQ